MLGIGLMSGTSLDGVDAALVRIDSPTHATLLDFVTRPYDEDERAEIRAALAPGGRRGPALLARLHVQHRGVGRRRGAAAPAPRPTRPPPSSRFIAFPGQTVWHEPPLGHLAARRAGDPGGAVRREGGERLPASRRGRGRAGRAARAHGRRAALRRRPITPACCSTSAGWRTSPTCRAAREEDGRPRLRHRAGRRDHRRRGAAGGRAPLVRPGRAHRGAGHGERGGAGRAAGRSVLRRAAAQEHRPRALRRPVRRASCNRRVPGPDGVATAVELTARSVADAVGAMGPRRRRDRRVGRRLPPSGSHGEPGAGRLDALPGRHPLRAFDELFFPGDAKEAVAFALLGYLTLHGQPGNVPAATGAAGSRVLGAVTPA